MASITIKRSAEWLNKLRDVHIIVDGVDFTTLKSGQRKVINLPPGEHEIQAKMSWFGSKKTRFTLKDSKYTSFHVKSFKHAKYTQVTTACIAPFYFIFLVQYAGFYATIASAVLLYFAYMIFLGRHKYLEIEDVSPIK